MLNIICSCLRCHAVKALYCAHKIDIYETYMFITFMNGEHGYTEHDLQNAPSLFSRKAMLVPVSLRFG